MHKATSFVMQALYDIQILLISRLNYVVDRYVNVGSRFDPYVMTSLLRICTVVNNIEFKKVPAGTHLAYLSLSLYTVISRCIYCFVHLYIQRQSTLPDIHRCKFFLIFLALQSALPYGCFDPLFFSFCLKLVNLSTFQHMGVLIET